MIRNSEIPYIQASSMSYELFAGDIFKENVPYHIETYIFNSRSTIMIGYAHQQACSVWLMV